MDKDSWEQISRIYQASLEVAEEERPEYLQKECAGDPELRAEVESLLAMHEHAGGFLGKPAVEEVAQEIKQGTPAIIGRKLGPYHVLDFIGAGGMGEVYKACDLRLNRSYHTRTVRILIAEGGAEECIDRKAGDADELSKKLIAQVCDNLRFMVKHQQSFLHHHIPMHRKVRPLGITNRKGICCLGSPQGILKHQHPESIGVIVTRIIF